MDRLREDAGFTRATRVRKALPQNWCSYASGHIGTSYNPSFAGNKRARVEVYIDGGDKEWNKQLFDRIEERKHEIESQIAGDFEWERLNEKRACRISVFRQGSIDDDEETLEEIHNWMIDRLIAFERVFGPILAELVE